MDLQLTGQLVDAALYAIGLATVLAIFLPFSPMTIDLVNLPRETQIAIYRHRAVLWSIAGTCLGLVLLRGLIGASQANAASAVATARDAWLASGSSAWAIATLVTIGVLIVLFWSGYVPFVMTPPSRHRILAAADADKILARDDVVLGIVCDDEVRAYPRDAIARPHYFSDTLASTPMMISYCILCNSALAFKSVLDGRVLDLKCVTAYNNNNIYHEPATGNFIQQLDGQVFDGPDAGKALDTHPVTLAAWGDWKHLHPDTTLYHAPTIGVRDKIVARMLQSLIPISRLSKRSRPWHRIRGKLDKRLPAMSFVIGVQIDAEACAYPLTALRSRPVLDDTVGGKPITLFYDVDHDVGAVFSRQVDSRTLTFLPSEIPGAKAGARDRETGTLWTLNGEAIEGPLRGRSLEPVPHVSKLFWFSWALFKPGTRVVEPTIEALLRAA